MARPYRIQGENCLYHITSRGDDRKKIFISEVDYTKFLEYLKSAQAKFKFYLYAYCLMDNHYHLFLETAQANLSRIMQYINTSYTVYYNVKRKKCGHLFQGRYKSILVEADSYFLELTRYIHLNPVRAKIVTDPEAYRWSSYNEYIKKTKDNRIDKEQLRKYYKLSCGSYKTFILDGINKEESPLSNLYAGCILGKEKFIKDTLAALKITVESKDFSHKKTLSGVDPKIIIQEVADYYKKEPEVLYKAAKKPVLAKKIAVYLLKKLTGLTNKEIGDMFGIGYSGVSWIAQNVEGIISRDTKVKEDIARLILRLKA
ncbi:MAG: transposase [Candidatus Omnitrophota bacterium]